MNIEIRKIEKSEIEKLNNLIQLYLHDISAYFSVDFDQSVCKYCYNIEPYIEDNYAYFILEKHNIVGFILVDDNKNNCYEISEIFIMNPHKKKHIGKIAVCKIFDVYKGDWTIKAVPNSPIAESFWKKVVDEYTKGKYKKIHTGKYKRCEIYFSNF